MSEDESLYPPNPVEQIETIWSGYTEQVVQRHVSVHHYVSTSCIHGLHERCSAQGVLTMVTHPNVNEGEPFEAVRWKDPSVCKTCRARCLCVCHCDIRDVQVLGEERIVQVCVAHADPLDLLANVAPCKRAWRLGPEHDKARKQIHG